jgi:hypothetical protein
MPLSTDENREADATKVKSAFWTPKQYAAYCNCSEGLLRKERINGDSAPFHVDAAGHVLYPIEAAKEHASRKPLFNSRAEVYAAHPALAERDERQAAVTERARAQRWTAKTRAHLARKPRPAAAKALVETS